MDALLTPVAKRLPRRRLLAGLAALAALGGASFALRPTGRAVAGPQVLDGATMGTSYTVKIAGRNLSPARLAALHADVHAAFAAVDERMSLYRPDSELIRVNAHPAGRVAVSPALLEVIGEAQAMARLSAGAFDPTVAPLVEAWGFGPGGPHGLPSAATLASGRRTVGHAGLVLDAATRTVTKAMDGLALDLGGIAKGRGVDAAAAVLVAAGIPGFMVEAGGEVVTRGVNASGRRWAIGIEEPDAWPRRARLVLPLGDEAIATSGDYRFYVEHAGRRYAHAIDPATAAPVAHGLASVSVIAADAMRADALATALLVLGPERGMALAQRLDLAAHFIIRDPDGALRDQASPALRARAAGQPA
jgi:thiamine biosynthesis lipoprotein